MEPISEERASRSLYRIQLLSKIREEVLFNYCCPVAATIFRQLCFFVIVRLINVIVSIEAVVLHK